MLIKIAFKPYNRADGIPDFGNITVKCFIRYIFQADYKYAE